MSNNTQREDIETDQREALRIEVFDPNLEGAKSWDTINSKYVSIAWIDEESKTLKVKGNIVDPFLIEGTIGALAETLLSSKSVKDRVLAQSILDSIMEFYQELQK